MILYHLSDRKIVACSWRLEPNIFNNEDRVGTTFAPVNDGFGVYHHDFNKRAFLEWADEFVKNDYPSYRKVEGVSYMMRTKYFVPNLDLCRPSSFEDMHQNVIMQIKKYDFVVTPRAMVWHFGARSSHFLGQHDKLTGTSDRQKESEAKNYRIWLELWGEPPTYDESSFIKVTPQMLERYNKIRLFIIINNIFISHNAFFHNAYIYVYMENTTNNLSIQCQEDAKQLNRTPEEIREQNRIRARRFYAKNKDKLNEERMDRYWREKKWKKVCNNCKD
jgi:hypothetical protein